MKRFSILLAALLMGTGSLLAQSHQWFTRHILSDKHAMMSVDTQKRYLLLPVEEKESETKIRIIKDGHSMQAINVRLATGKPDYYVPLDLSRFGKDGSVLLDLNFKGNYRTVGNIEDYSRWQTSDEGEQHLRHRQPRGLPTRLSPYSSVGMDERPQRIVL